MPFCSKCGAKIKDNDVFCSVCGVNVSSGETKPNNNVSNEPKVVERIIEKEIHKEPVKKSGGFSFILFLILLILLLFILSSGALDKSAKGSGIAYVDPCMRTFETCNYGCGEGVLSSICKEKCSYEYRQCKNS